MPLPCSDCSLNLGLFKKKHTCGKCLAIFCGKCFTKTTKLKVQATVSHAHCLKCNIFSLQVFRREDLLLLSTKDLRYFLSSKNISMKNCTEKFHLVDLIMHFAESNGQKSVTDLRREEVQRAHVESLRQAAQRMEMENTQSPGPEDPSAREEINVNNSPDNLDAVQPGSTPEHELGKRWKSIEDISSLSEIHSLSTRELKKILLVNCVDYKGCFEKSELIEKVKRLWTSHKEEGSNLKSSDEKEQSVYDENLCKICLDAEINCVLLNCGHFVSCTKCGRKLAECPICRQLIVRIVHIFRA